MHGDMVTEELFPHDRSLFSSFQPQTEVSALCSAQLRIKVRASTLAPPGTAALKLFGGCIRRHTLMRTGIDRQHSRVQAEL